MSVWSKAPLDPAGAHKTLWSSLRALLVAFRASGNVSKFDAVLSNAEDWAFSVKH